MLQYSSPNNNLSKNISNNSYYQKNLLDNNNNIYTKFTCNK
jgi:hypothetical protein